MKTKIDLIKENKKLWKAYNIFIDYFNCFDDDDKVIIDKRLKRLGL